jgi:hypothetical protein
MATGAIGHKGAACFFQERLEGFCLFMAQLADPHNGAFLGADDVDHSGGTLLVLVLSLVVSDLAVFVLGGPLVRVLRRGVESTHDEGLLLLLFLGLWFHLLFCGSFPATKRTSRFSCNQTDRQVSCKHFSCISRKKMLSVIRLLQAGLGGSLLTLTLVGAGATLALAYSTVQTLALTVVTATTTVLIAGYGVMGLISLEVLRFGTKLWQKRHQ